MAAPSSASNHLHGLSSKVDRILLHREGIFIMNELENTHETNYNLNFFLSTQIVHIN